MGKFAKTSTGIKVMIKNLDESYRHTEQNNFLGIEVLW